MEYRTQILRRFIRWREKRKASKFAKRVHPLKLDIGSGAIARPGFIGIDLSARADIVWDLKWGLPFPDNTVSEIRSDHCFEHLELSLVMKVLSECYRALLPGGMLDFSVPHFNPYLDAYLRQDYAFLREEIFDIPKDQVEMYGTCFDRIVWLLYRNGEHKSMFDKFSILDKVRLAGFSNVHCREYDPARDVKRRFSSIYVVAIK
jgi:predicted SAM-dependent methyltransferase